MARRGQTASSGRSVLIIDDNEEYLASCVRMVTRDGHEALSASSAIDALEILKIRRVDVVLVDYFMPAMTGEQFVTELRKFNPLVQVILQTGFAGEHPPREMLRRLDIQGYHDKSEGPDKLGLWIDVGLRAAFTVSLLNASRQGLAYILEVTPELHKIQPLEQLLQGVLTQTVGLLGAVDSFLAVASGPVDDDAEDHGFVAMPEREGTRVGRLRICAATGKFAGRATVEDSMPPDQLQGVLQALDGRRAQLVGGGTVVPLRVADTTLGLIYLDRTISVDRDVELMAIFANQAAVAIRNTTLYELAAVDQLTRVYTRGFFEHALLRELRTAHRHSEPLGLVLVDIDDMKRLNDQGGHLCGDRALEGVGELLRTSTRATDIVGRYGGDEFAVVLPKADASGAEIVVRRILEGAARLSVPAADGSSMPVRVTVGGTVLSGATAPMTPRPQHYFQTMALATIARTDERLYHAKHDGKGRASPVLTHAWSEDDGVAPAAKLGMPALDR